MAAQVAQVRPRLLELAVAVVLADLLIPTLFSTRELAKLHTLLPLVLAVRRQMIQRHSPSAKMASHHPLALIPISLLRAVEAAALNRLVIMAQVAAVDPAAQVLPTMLAAVARAGRVVMAVPARPTNMAEAAEALEGLVVTPLVLMAQEKVVLACHLRFFLMVKAMRSFMLVVEVVVLVLLICNLVEDAVAEEWVALKMPRLPGMVQMVLAAAAAAAAILVLVARVATVLLSFALHSLSKRKFQFQRLVQLHLTRATMLHSILA